MEDSKTYFVIFLTSHLYYIPQFYPIAKELKKRNHTFLFLLEGKDLPSQNKIAEDFCANNGYDYAYVDKNVDRHHCKFLINGGHSFPKYPIKYQKTISVTHGIGTKVGYYTEEQQKHDIRFIEGPERVNKIQTLFPNSKCSLYNVGFAKLDTAVNFSTEEKNELKLKCNLDLDKPTILYAPTFYPSSIDKMPSDFPKDFQQYNIIIKPHFFSFLKKKYSHHLRKFKKWDKYTNVYFANVEEFDLCPFMAISDMMISDESSAIFEFAALNKPVIINRNIKFRLSYRLFKSKINKRMDSLMSPYREIGQSIFNYNDLLVYVKKEMNNPDNKIEIRKKISAEIVGTVDGNVSNRIVDILEKL